MTPVPPEPDFHRCLWRHPPPQLLSYIARVFAWCWFLEFGTACCQISSFIPRAKHYRRGGLDSGKNVSFTRATKPVLRILDRIDPLANLVAMRWMARRDVPRQCREAVRLPSPESLSSPRRSRGGQLQYILYNV